MLSMNLSASRIQRFWSKVDRSGDCWIWTACRHKQGYGEMGVWVGGKVRTLLAHRAAWALMKGEIPKGLLVLHRCDNPPCVNPSHLFLGTQRDNMRDCSAKGRAGKLRGSQIGNSKLTEEQVVEIRRLFSLGGMSKAALGRMFGVTDVNIFDIVARKRWKHVK